MKVLLEKCCKDSMYRNSSALMLNSTFGAVFGLLFWIIIARTMSAENVGLATATISALSLITTLSRFGLDQGLVRFLPESKDKNKIYTTVIILTLILALVITCMFLIGINVFSPALSFLRKGVFLPVFLAYMIISSIYSIQNITLVAIRRSDISLIQNILLGARVPSVILLAPLGVLGVLSASGIAFMLALLFGGLVLHKCGLAITRDFDIASIKTILRFSFGNYSAGIFMMAPVTIIPIMIVNTVGAEEGAYFYIAYSVAAILFMIPNAASTSLFVEGAHNLPIKQNVLKSIKFVFILLTPALILILCFGDYFLLLFNTEYSEEAFEMLQLLAASSIFSSVTSIYITVKKIQKEVNIINYLNFALSLMVIIFGYMALLKYGLVGLGYAWLGANIVICTVVLGLIMFREKWN